MSNRREQQQLLTGNQPLPQIIKNGTDNSERSPFLQDRNKPVSLTPSWEQRNLPNDELNFKGMTMDRAKMEISPPYDKWKLVFLIFMLHGLGTLMPWNMFITAKSYFVEFKLNTTLTTSEDSTYSTNFLAYIGFASQIPNVIFNWLNVFVNMGGDLTKRIVWSILIEICVFIVTVVLAMLDSSSWPGAFFWITMFCVVILNMANGIYQNTVFGMVATLPIKYTGAVVLGSNISGLFASVISICSSLIFSSQRTAAIYYFITAMFVLLVCFDTYFALPLNRFFRYNELMREKETNQVAIDDKSRPPYWAIFKKASPQLFNVFFLFFITLAVFPAVHSDVKRSDKGFFVPEHLYTSITCFLTFNFFAMVGSLCTSWVQWPRPKYLWIPVVLRVVFLPLFIICNYQPQNITRSLPVYIHNDFVYWAIAIVMSFSSGYLSSLGMMYTPQTVAQKHQVTAGMFAAAMLITGIFTGITFTMVFPIIVANVSF
ncbi:equilibrative nucleoside transporter 1 isoform X2 [Eupeodes corollae]|uniref:equilibrative nucleoside transporter 1 isoform X2 n=1 Tax=Eupeodes corollae TaxID=290404 RepID=UPI0024911FD4|nr:equilibrative nucleoside transporter 1 isoform X2 [Eupeodes corollae]XP_055923969.1 equilibrative nucleoside transporter 1 isoform X2 [Eupeodes corollae]